MKGLLNERVTSVLPKEEQELAFLRADEDITQTAFLSLVAAGVYSLPVKNEHDAIVGMLDQADFTRLLVQIFTGDGDRKPKLRVQDVMNLSGRDQLVSILQTDSLHDLLTALVTQKVHRLIVQHNADPKKQWLVSQLDVASYFSEHLPADVASRKLSTLGGKDLLAFENDIVVNAHEHDSVLHCIQLLDRHAISAVAIVDEFEHLVGNFSLKDVPRGLDHLFDTCGKFVTQDAGPIRDVACVDLDSTLGQLLQGFKVTRYHRFWVVNAEKAVIGCISLTDVMRTLKNMQ